MFFCLDVFFPQDVDVVYAHLSLLMTDYLQTEFFHQAVLPEAQHTWKDRVTEDRSWG